MCMYVIVKKSVAVYIYIYTYIYIYRERERESVCTIKQEKHVLITTCYDI